jgi:hypothetical protein
MNGRAASTGVLPSTMAVLMLTVFKVSMVYGVLLPRPPYRIEGLLGTDGGAAQVSRSTGLLTGLYQRRRSCLRRTLMFGSAASLSRRARIVLLVALLSLFLSGCGVNNIPTYEEQAKAKWSDVLNQYQRRNDLIPNLVETVKGFAQQERSVLEAVTTARARHVYPG